MATDFWKGKTGALLSHLLGLEAGAVSTIDESGQRSGQRFGQSPDPNTSKWYDGTEVKSLSLGQMLKEEASSGGGDKVYTVTLDDFASAVGDKWSRLKVKVDLIADGVARRHVGKGVLCTSLADGSLMVTVLGQGTPEGRRRIVGLADDLGHRLVGAMFDAKQDAKVRISEVDPMDLLDLLGTDGNVNADVLARLAQAPEIEITADMRRPDPHAHEGSHNQPEPAPCDAPRISPKAIPVEDAVGIQPHSAKPEEASVAPNWGKSDTRRIEQMMNRTSLLSDLNSPILSPQELSLESQENPDWGKSYTKRVELEIKRAAVQIDDGPPILAPVGRALASQNDPDWGKSDTKRVALEIKRAAAQIDDGPPILAPVGRALASQSDPDWGKSDTRRVEDKLARISSGGDEKSPEFVLNGGVAAPQEDPEWGHSENRRDERKVSQTVTGADGKSPIFVPITHVSERRGDPNWINLERSDISPSAQTELAPPERPLARPTSSKEARQKVRVAYRPTWNMASHTLTTHFCVPEAHHGAASHLDFEMTLAVMIRLGGASAGSLGGTIILPLHFASLCDSDSVLLRSAIEGCSASVGARNFMIEVYDIPRTVTSEAMDAALALVRPLCHGFLLRTDLFAPMFEALVPCVPLAIGVDMETLTERDRTKERLLPALAAFHHGAWGIPGYLWGIRLLWEIEAAVEHKFILINGAALLPDVLAPGTSKPMLLTNLKGS